jgi:hypothetical protein
MHCRLLLAVLGPSRTVGVWFVIRLRGNAVLTLFLTFVNAIAAFALAISGRISFRHLFHDIDLLDRGFILMWYGVTAMLWSRG